MKFLAQTLAISSTVAVTVALLGCAAPKVPVTQQFVGAEHDAYLAPGKNTVAGQGFLRQQGGGTVTCAGGRVVMLPATPFFMQAVDIIRSGRTPEFAAGLDQAYRPLIKTTQCDAQGNFAIAKVPPGRWYVLTEVKWMINYARQGGMLGREIVVSDNDTERLLLSDREFLAR